MSDCYCEYINDHVDIMVEQMAEAVAGQVQVGEGRAETRVVRMTGPMSIRPLDTSSVGIGTNIGGLWGPPGAVFGRVAGAVYSYFFG